MNLHEYQGKEMLNSFGVEIQRGIVAQNPAEAVAAAKKLTEDTGTGWHVIKAQVHAGGRGKGGGVKLAKSLVEVEQIADQIETGTVFLNRADYLDPALCWTGCKNTGSGGGLSIIGFHNLTRPKSYHLKKVTQ